MVTKELLESRLAALRQQLEQTTALAQNIAGAIQFGEHLLAEEKPATPDPTFDS